MTDTTDIKALIYDVCLAAAGIHNLGRSVSDERAQGVIDFIRSKLESAFEAERQRADEEFILIGYAEDGKGFVYEPRHQDRISNPIAIYRRKES